MRDDRRSKLLTASVSTAAWALGPLVFALGPAVAADPGALVRGERYFRACAACHSFTPDHNMTGPSLSGIVGRKAGTLASFSRYSPAIKASNVVWTAATLDPWLADPQKFIPGTYMTFPGIPQSQIRADLIAYVSKAAAPGQAPKEDFGAGAPGDKDLKKLDPAHRVRAISYCPDAYQVITADGKTHVIWERNLRFQTDSSAIGPLKGAPAIMRAGMEGDRASVIFSAPQEIGSFVKKTC